MNSLLVHIQVMLLTRANLTVGSAEFNAKFSNCVFLRELDNGYFYEVLCYSEHLPRKWETTHCLVASSEAVDSAFLTS